MSCDLYMKQKLLNFKGPEMQRKRAVQLTEVPQHIKPVNGITRKEIQEAKGNEKRTRMDDNQLTSRLLELFEKHQVFFFIIFADNNCVSVLHAERFMRHNKTAYCLFERKVKRNCCLQLEGNFAVIIF
jgi:hypothetical protein